MHIDNLHELMVEELKDLYDAEKQITEALPKMINKTENPSLRQAFEDHLAQTEDQVRRLERIFDDLNISDRHKECKGMRAILQEGEEKMKSTSDPMARDAGMIASAQHVEHYEMAGYGTVVSYANHLEHNSVADQLQKTLNEEKQTDLILSQIAEEKVNIKAR